MRTQQNGYVFRETVTFSLTDAEGTVSHHEYARLFGVAREILALNALPGFKENVGKQFLLKTINASYEYRKSFFFGDTIEIVLWVSEFSSASFILEAVFMNGETREVHATGRQKIVYTDMRGKPTKLPQALAEQLNRFRNGQATGRSKTDTHN